MENQDHTYCQSCGMPLSAEYFGTNGNGSPNHEYCSYCYKDGAFTSDESMDQMIEHNLEYLMEYNKDADRMLTVEEARAQMRQFFPTLKRWQA